MGRAKSCNAVYPISLTAREKLGGILTCSRLFRLIAVRHE